jgi:hypothetical protein
MAYPRLAGSCHSLGPSLITAGVILELFSVGPLVSWLHREGKELPIFFPAQHSFLFDSEKSDFNSNWVPSRSGQSASPPVAGK